MSGRWLWSCTNARACCNGIHKMKKCKELSYAPKLGVQEVNGIEVWDIEADKAYLERRMTKFMNEHQRRLHEAIARHASSIKIDPLELTMFECTYVMNLTGGMEYNHVALLGP